MIIHGSFRHATATLVAAIALTTTPALGQQPDMDAMMKWSSAPVVHYKVAGEYTGEAMINGRAANQSGGVTAKFTDRVEIEFDWNQFEMKVVGTIAIRNFPTKSEPIQYERRCAAPKLEGTFEFGTLTAVKQASPASPLKLELKQDLVGGDVQFMGEGSCGVSKMVATSSTFTKDHMVLPPIVMAMPQAGMTKTPDGKSIIQKDPRDDGWVWTTTMTIK